MDNSTLLKEAGLTSGQSRVYLALLRLGESSVGPAAREARVSVSKVYILLDGLIKRGLATSSRKNDVLQFQAAQPSQVLQLLEIRKTSIQHAQDAWKKEMPKLSSTVGVQLVRVFEGLIGIKAFYEEMLQVLKKGKFLLTMGVPKEAAERYEGYFLDWNKRRAEKGVLTEIIYDAGTRKAGAKRARLPCTRVRYLKGLVTPSWTIIFDDTVATIHLVERPLCVVVKDPIIAQSHRKFFSLLWDRAVP